MPNRPNKFDELLDQLVTDDHMTTEAASRIREASAGSPLRQQIDEANERATKAEGDLVKFRDEHLKAQFEKNGVKISPRALNLPADLDVLDESAVKAFLVEAGAIEPEPAVADQEFERQERAASAANGEGTQAPPGVLTPTVAASWPPDKWTRFRKEHPEAAEQLLQGSEVTGVVY